MSDLHMDRGTQLEKSSWDVCARENFARAELLCLERVIGGEREFQISWMQKQLPQT